MPSEPPNRFIIDPELKPLYQLTETQYQSVINRMSNLLGEVAQRLAQDDNTELAQTVTEQGYEILRDYDDDVAEAIRWVARLRRLDQFSIGHAREIERILL